ncbi:Curli production assembly/transport component CsgG [Parelusimicrobium proximum]|uniref:CsgG/HfaB family protein n=1 Tax=Parelusimicrobium proximum TaxID=3228953 RepID=UPI003D183BAE
MRKISAILTVTAVTFFLSACSIKTVISPSYDFNSMNRIGVLAFTSPWDSFNGAENLFAKYFMENGFTVVERAQIEKVLREHNISVSGYMSPETTKMLGRILGVDVLLIGEITSFIPEKKVLTTVEKRSSNSTPVFSTERVITPEGGTIEYTRQTGTRTTRSSERTPSEVTLNAQVGVVAKLVDVETAEIVWIGTDTGSGYSSLSAVDGSAKALVRSFAKELKKQQRRINKANAL